ncbi:MAG: phage tail tape measure protein [Porphyromonadaceae bacterium]|nr:phage tail tape measure protein [Porphyromonadaceae bacterium]
MASDSGSHTQQLDFVVGITNMTWPGIAAVESGFANLTAAGMRTTNVLNSQMNTLSAGMMAMGGIAALVLAKATAEAAQFEKQMSVVQALIKDNGDSVGSLQGRMEGLSAIAKDMSLKYGVSATDIAKSMETLGRAGLNTATQMQAVLEPALQLSKIEGISVDTSADYIVKMTNLFGGTYEQDSKEYATILAHAANISTTSATDIYNALKYAGGVSANIWGSATSEQRYENAKNITAMIATLSQQGVTGSYAGTSIRSFFQYVANPTTKTKKELAKIGLNSDSLLTVDEKGQKIAKSPMEIMNTLNAAFKANKMSDFQILQWFQNWGQPKMGQQYVKLFPGGTESSLLSDYVKKMNESYNMEDRLNTIMSSTSEQLNKLKAAFEVMGISIGETSLPFLKALAMVLTDITGLLAHSKIAATAFTAVLYGSLFAGLYSVAKWLAPLFTTPLRDMSTFVGKAKQQVAEIKGTTTALGAEANAANNVAGAMDEKAAAKDKATRANKQLATSAGATATSINKVKGEVTGATVATKEYTGRIQDLEKNHVPITAHNGSAADAKKMAEYEKTFKQKYNPFATFTAENGLGYYGIANDHERKLEDLGKQVREQEWAKGSVVQGDVTNKLESLQREVAAKERAASLVPSFGTGSMWTAKDIEYYLDEQDRINKLAKENSVGRKLDYGKLLGETNTPGNVANLVSSNMDAITWSQMSTVERMQARSEQIKGKVNGIAEKNRLWKENLVNKMRSSGVALASKAKNVGMTGLEWLGGLVGLGGWAGGALVAGAAVGIGAYYYAKSQGAFDTSNTKATKSLKEEIKYVKDLSNKKDDLQKRINTLTNAQSKYTEGSIQYRNIGKDIVSLNKDLTSTTSTYNAAQKQLTKDEERAYASNQKFATLLANTSSVGDLSVENAIMQQQTGINPISSNFNSEMDNGVDPRTQTFANIQAQAQGLEDEFVANKTPASKFYHTSTGYKAYETIAKDYDSRQTNFLLSQGYYKDNNGHWQEMDPNATRTDFVKAYGWLAYMYDINKIKGERGFASYGLQFPDPIKTLWNGSGLGGLGSVINPKNWEGFGGVGSIMSLSKGDTLKKFFSNFGGLGALNGIFNPQTSKKKTQGNNSQSSLPITFNIGSIVASSPEEAQNILKNSVVEAAASIFSQSNSPLGSG